jgi:hypothetical protein
VRVDDPLRGLLEPISVELVKGVLASRVIPTDDTSVHVAERSDGSHKDARVWPGEKGEHVYDYTESRSRDGPRRMLGCTGLIQADAYKGYDAFFGPELATEVACWAHGRRYFEKAEATDPTLAEEALERIGGLYEIERDAKEQGLGEDALRELRQRGSAPRNPCSV